MPFLLRPVIFRLNARLFEQIEREAEERAEPFVVVDLMSSGSHYPSVKLIFVARL